MLFTHSMPHNIVVCKSPPSLADLSGFTQRRRIEVAENPEGQFRGQGGQKVDTNQFSDICRKVGQLWEAALR